MKQIKSISVIIRPLFYDHFFVLRSNERSRENKMRHTWFAVPIGIMSQPFVQTLTPAQLGIFFRLLAYISNTRYAATCTLYEHVLYMSGTRCRHDWNIILEKLQAFQYLEILHTDIQTYKQYIQTDKKQNAESRKSEPEMGASPSAPSQGGASASAKQNKELDQEIESRERSESSFNEKPNGAPTEIVHNYLGDWGLDDARDNGKT